MAQRRPYAAFALSLRPINCNYSKPYPPDGYNKIWWERLKAALGTTSSDFVNATLVQIQNASRLPCGGICEISVNAALAFIEAAEPKNEIEAALGIQMACTHAVAMAVLNRAGGAYGGNRHVAMMRLLGYCTLSQPRSRLCADSAAAERKSFASKGWRSRRVGRQSLEISRTYPRKAFMSTRPNCAAAQEAPLKLFDAAHRGPKITALPRASGALHTELQN